MSDKLKIVGILFTSYAIADRVDFSKKQKLTD